MQKQHNNHIRQYICPAKGNFSVGGLFVYNDEVIDNRVEAARSTGNIANHSKEFSKVHNL